MNADHLPVGRQAEAGSDPAIGGRVLASPRCVAGSMLKRNDQVCCEALKKIRRGVQRDDRRILVERGADVLDRARRRRESTAIALLRNENRAGHRRAERDLRPVGRPDRSGVGAGLGHERRGPCRRRPTRSRCRRWRRWCWPELTRWSKAISRAVGRPVELADGERAAREPARLLRRDVEHPQVRHPVALADHVELAELLLALLVGVGLRIGGGEARSTCRRATRRSRRRLPRARSACALRRRADRSRRPAACRRDRWRRRASCRRATTRATCSTSSRCW